MIALKRQYSYICIVTLPHFIYIVMSPGKFPNVYGLLIFKFIANMGGFIANISNIGAFVVVALSSKANCARKSFRFRETRVSQKAIIERETPSTIHNKLLQRIISHWESYINKILSNVSVFSCVQLTVRCSSGRCNFLGEAPTLYFAKLKKTKSRK